MNRGDVYLVALDPTVGSEVRKTRPCVIISPNEMNIHLLTVIVAPMTSRGKEYPSRVRSVFGGKQGLVLLDQLRTIDKTRLVRKLGTLGPSTCANVLAVLVEMFTPNPRPAVRLRSRETSR